MMMSMGGGGKSPRILIPLIRRNKMFSFMHRPFIFRGRPDVMHRIDGSSDPRAGLHFSELGTGVSLY